ncbi:MAG TPA: MmgE/PrpD family protein [Bradyrhizobium sp.]|nr:MmgE/PrpD family protein [Bradyrhizobium sp.]
MDLGATISKPPPFTRALAARVCGLRFGDLPEDIVARARHSILDWLGVTLSGWRDPLVAKLTRVIETEGGAPVATLVGSGRKVSASQAALVNGTASHALDFDDVHLSSRVHPSVPVAPAALAVAERDRRDGKALITAFVAGVEAQSAIAAVMGEAHYKRGWHNTATLGMFGAAAAAGHLEGLTIEQMQHAFGIAATQAAGLRMSFGTMCKPLHAGHAASRGLSAAALAREGFTSRSDALECADGFAAMLGGDDSLQRMAVALNSHDALDPDRFHTRAIMFKFHASCYGTHAPIESALRLREQLKGSLPENLDVSVEPQYMSVCNIAVPSTPLEAKFSIRHAVALALLGYDLADGESFAAATNTDPKVTNLRERITVAGDASIKRANARIDAHLADGTTLSVSADASRAETDLARQARRVEAKFAICARERMDDSSIARTIEMCRELDRAADITTLMTTLHTPGDADHNHSRRLQAVKDRT